jgi:hypothetical protein
MIITTVTHVLATVAVHGSVVLLQRPGPDDQQVVSSMHPRCDEWAAPPTAYAEPVDKCLDE